MPIVGDGGNVKRKGAVLIPFPASGSSRGWSSLDFGELYRLVDLLARQGLPVALDTGFSDEGDPWATVYREDTGDVLIHVARIDNQLVLASAAEDAVRRGRDLRALIEATFAGRWQGVLASGDPSRLALHPSAMFLAIAVTAWMHTEHRHEEKLVPQAPLHLAKVDGTAPLEAPRGLMREGVDPRVAKTTAQDGTNQLVLFSKAAGILAAAIGAYEAMDDLVRARGELIAADRLGALVEVERETDESVPATTDELVPVTSVVLAKTAWPSVDVHPTDAGSRPGVAASSPTRGTGSSDSSLASQAYPPGKTDAPAFTHRPDDAIATRGDHGAVTSETVVLTDGRSFPPQGDSGVAVAFSDIANEAMPPSAPSKPSVRAFAASAREVGQDGSTPNVTLSTGGEPRSAAEAHSQAAQRLPSSGEASANPAMLAAADGGSALGGGEILASARAILRLSARTETAPPAPSAPSAAPEATADSQRAPLAHNEPSVSPAPHARVDIASLLFQYAVTEPPATTLSASHLKSLISEIDVSQTNLPKRIIVFDADWVSTNIFPITQNVIMVENGVLPSSALSWFRGTKISLEVTQNLSISLIGVIDVVPSVQPSNSFLPLVG